MISTIIFSNSFRVQVNLLPYNVSQCKVRQVLHVAFYVDKTLNEHIGATWGDA